MGSAGAASLFIAVVADVPSLKPEDFVKLGADIVEEAVAVGAATA